MPESKSRRPRAATCEDWDDDAETILPGSRKTANVAVKRAQRDLVAVASYERRRNDGTDSGYASKAGTVASEPTSDSKMSHVKAKPAVVERERQPYHKLPIRSKPNGDVTSQAKETKPASKPAKKQLFVHAPTTCWICDQYGEHIDIKQDMSRASSVAPPASPKLTRDKAARVTRDESATDLKSRRLSSNHQSRPLNIYPPTTMQSPYAASPPVYSTPMVAAAHWQIPMTPAVAYSPYAYSYPTPTAANPTYPSYSQDASYFDTRPVPEIRPPATRRSSTYGPPIVEDPRTEPRRQAIEQAAPKKESRPAITTYSSARSVDQDRKDMPPPPRPPQQKEGSDACRPSMRKHATYNTFVPEKRRSKYSEDDELLDSRPSVVYEERPPSPSRPPSSFKAPERPQQMRKSVSYNEPKDATKVIYASSKELHLPRRTTMPTTPSEHKEAEAEAYQLKRSMTSKELSEVLREKMIPEQTLSSVSESGSNYSRRSHRSSSKASSGRDRSHTAAAAPTSSGGKTNISIDGMTLTVPSDYSSKRPVSINFGDLTVSLGSKDKHRDDERKEQRRIERAPSVSSRTSRHSISSSVVSTSKGKERDLSKHSSRSPSFIEQRTPGKKSSHQPSCAPSSTRGSVDYTRRQSIDYGYAISRPREDDMVYGA